MAQAFLLTLFATLIALALFVWRARPQSRINQSFTAFTVFVACWVLGVAGLQGGSYLNAWGRFTFASAVLIPLAFLELTHVYPARSNWPRREIRMALRYIGLAIAIVSVATPFVVRNNVVTPSVRFSLSPVLLLLSDRLGNRCYFALTEMERLSRSR